MHNHNNTTHTPHNHGHLYSLGIHNPALNITPEKPLNY